MTSPSSPRSLGRRDLIAPYISLFGSVSTLLCCALPALLVTLGAGATLAGLVGAAPWLVVLSRYKLWTFGAAGLLLLAAGVMRYRARNAPCPIDPAEAAACDKLRKISAIVYWSSVALYATGIFFAFVAPRLFF